MKSLVFSDKTDDNLWIKLTTYYSKKTDLDYFIIFAQEMKGVFAIQEIILIIYFVDQSA